MGAKSRASSMSSWGSDRTPAGCRYTRACTSREVPATSPGAGKLSAMDQSRAEGGSSVGRFGKHVLAAIVLLLAAWIVIKLVVGIVTALFVPILVIAAIVAIVWAARVLF
jgi:hypothetical protein